jgi:RimJ/RimL family protein N-acetyltransferase
LRALRNDTETQAWNKSLPPDFTEVMYTKRFEAREFSYDPDEARFTIVHRETAQPVGYIGYSGLERRFSASIGIAVAKEYWGTGIALDAQEVLLRFLFTELGLQVVRVWTHSANPGAVKLAEKSGFQVSGRQRQAVIRNGELCDNLIVDLLREEYFARHPDLIDNLSPIP